MRAYARPDVSAKTWLEGLSPWLTADARIAYAGTDPANVAVRAITGPARLTPASTAALARVAVPTRDGSYLLLLTRSTTRRTWLVTRILAPEVVE